jgi:hypothetical protein
LLVLKVEVGAAALLLVLLQPHGLCLLHCWEAWPVVASASSAADPAAASAAQYCAQASHQVQIDQMMPFAV